MLVEEGLTGKCLRSIWTLMESEVNIGESVPGEHFEGRRRHEAKMNEYD